MSTAKRYKIGFFKAVQGAFTEEVITAIKQRLERDYDAMVTEVDFRDGVLVDGKVYVDDICLNDFDVYFWHDTLWPAQTGSDSYYVHLLRAIGRDVTVINTADSTERVNDKLRAHEVLRAAGLPVSEYALVHSNNKPGVAAAFKRLGGEVLIKPRFGGWGKGIVRCSSAEDLQDII
jgi:glutathione synthase/RimK-type ligase-like ATP-grasp enzyme